MSYYDPEKDHEGFLEYQYQRMANNYASWTRFANWSHERRVEAARKYGPNWASILSGCGDQ